MNALTSDRQRDIHHAVLVQKLSHHVGHVVFMIAPFKAVAPIDIVLPSDDSHAVSNSFPFQFFATTDRTQRTRNSERDCDSAKRSRKDGRLCSHFCASIYICIVEILVDRIIIIIIAIDLFFIKRNIVSY